MTHINISMTTIVHVALTRNFVLITILWFVCCSSPILELLIIETTQHLQTLCGLVVMDTECKGGVAKC